MSFSAIQSAGDSIDVTREYLASRSWRQVALLAVMAIFLGPAGVSGPPGPVDIEDEAFQVDDDLPSLSELIGAIDWELVLIALILVAAFVVLYGLISAFMEFGFVHSLTTDTVAIRAPARDHWTRAFSLFLFRAVVWGIISLGGVALIAVGLGIFTLPFELDLMLLSLVLLLAGVSLYLLNRFTTDFVVPIMYHERRGLISAWRRLLGVMRHEWRQYVAYVPVRIILELALGIAFGIVLVLLFIAMGIIIGVPLGVLTVLLLGVVPGIVITGGVLAIVALILLAAVMVPFHTYLRYYTLLVLGDTSDALDLIPTKRSSSRSEPDTATAR